MICGGVCSGISAPAVAWEPLGWQWAFESEIEAFPSAVMEFHRPAVPNLGDMNDYRRWPDATIDLLVGGTPCQSFSIAGLRQGLDDPRGNLALVFIGLVERYQPRWVVWENVPGVLSSNRGGDFQSFIRGMAEIGYFGAWRVLDAQWFGVAQRRRRVFAVFCPGDWRPAAAVLFEPESLRGNPAPSHQAREEFAESLTSRFGTSGPDAADACARHLTGCLTPGLTQRGRIYGEGGVAPSLQSEQDRGHGFPSILATGLPQVAPLAFSCKDDGGGQLAVAFKASHYTRGKDGAPSDVVPPLRVEDDRGDQSPLIFTQELADPITAHEQRTYTHEGKNNFRTRNVVGVERQVFQPRFARNGRGAPDDICPALTSEPGKTGKGDSMPCVFSIMPMNSNRDYKAREVEVVQPLMAKGPVTGAQGGDYVLHSAVRRLTPRECERLQGFPDDYTMIPWRGKPAELCPDGPRYKALGNSMAVPVISWIGRRIQAYEASR